MMHADSSVGDLHQLEDRCQPMMLMDLPPTPESVNQAVRVSFTS